VAGGGRGEILLSSRHQPVNVFVSRRACTVFVLVGLSGFPGGLWQFFVGAVVTRSYFVELARLIVLFRVGLTHQFFCWRCSFGGRGK
jgi:hypothetical protein